VTANPDHKAQGCTALTVDPQEARYFQALAQDVFEIPHCTSCGRWHFYPRTCCPYCHAETLQWRKPSGRATVYSTTTVRRPDGGDYCVCLVDLDEGPRMMTTIINIAPTDVRIGMSVQACVQKHGHDGAQTPLLVFAPIRDEGRA